MTAISLPSNAQENQIQIQNGKRSIPNQPIIPFIEGDGCGADIWRATRHVLDTAVSKAYGAQRQISWLEVYAGEKALSKCNTWLPEETLHAFRTYTIGIKGPLATPVGEGIRSLNVALRQTLDLYVCLRPVRWFPALPSPTKNPEKVNMVIFRENTEDLYTGIEFASDSPEATAFKEILKSHFPQQYEKIRFPHSSGIGIKPISKEGSQRLVKAAIQWALENQRRSVTLVHKGNIMKYTEGAFRNWGYEIARQNFADQIYTQLQYEETKKRRGEAAATSEMKAAQASGKLIIKDIIADAAFERALTYPQDFDVLATTNLNGDYLSDALAAQVGGLGIAPGANINFETGAAIFEATHGTAPDIANQDKANPCSLILSGEMMLRYMGWNEAADLIIKGIEGALYNRTVTFDLYRLMENATLLTTSQFGNAIVENM
ncbi:MAG: NADP-dependent isocitrate dehydrogenase [Anaerolineae bacterium]|nr:NADP-dependent isocitrate dehydrogenase [Anaerolineae bacterium]